jgi:hypothetical protein
MIHCLSTWTLLILAPKVVEGRYLVPISVSTTVGRCGRPTSIPWDEPTWLRDAEDCLRMMVVVVDQPDKWTH